MHTTTCQGVVGINKRPWAMRRALPVQVLLPIFVISFLFSYYVYRSCLPCFLQSIELSFTATLGHFTNKKAFFLLYNFILLFLAIDFYLRGSSAFMNNVCDDQYLMRLGNDLPSQSGVVPAKARDVVEEKIVLEQSFTNNIYDDLFIQDHDIPPFYEKYYGDATSSSVRTLDVFQEERDIANKLSQGWLALDDQPWQSNSAEVEQVVEEKELTVETTRDLEVVVVKEVVRGEAKPVRIKGEFELLSIDELNQTFEEFIQREKRKRRLEALQLVMV